MSDAMSMHETILKLCAQAAPSPWFPGEFARAMGVDRDRFDPALNDLRVAGLIEIADWVSGRGQGYLLTAEGQSVVLSPRNLATIRSDRFQTRPSPPASRRRETLDESTPYGRGEAIRNALLYPEKPRVTYVLMAINIFVFVAGAIIALLNGRPIAFIAGGDRATLHLTGSVTGADIVRGDWWRLLSCCFVHWGFLHVFMNMYSLYVLGPFVEQLWGRPRYLTIYLVAGIGGSCAAIFHQPQSQLAGASGAIWGLLGALAVWWVVNRRYLPKSLVRAQLGQLVTVLIMNGVLSMLPGISWTAHFAGGAFGGLAAVFLHLHRFGRQPWRWACLLVTATLPLLSIGALVYIRNKDPRWNQVVVLDDVNAFERHFAPRIRSTERDVEKHRRGMRQFERLDQRHREEVRLYQEDLITTRTEADRLAKELEATEFRSAKIKESAKVAVLLLRHAIRLVDLIHDRLETNDEFDEAVQAQIERYQNAELQWIKTRE